MRLACTTCFLLLFPVLASASPDVTCALENNGERTLVSVPTTRDALEGAWQEVGRFRVRTLVAAPAGRRPWLQVEVYARAARVDKEEDGEEDYRIIASQKVLAPFATGRMEVVEPRLGRSLSYECGAAK
ncbi:hypothetical protein [Niveibacterium sp. SC-1]|uniref:hypothetical protein n=1 Tax=Niveibacterium sp. SC-1 TaxID=3135646 RepID=UPI00311DEA1A